MKKFLLIVALLCLADAAYGQTADSMLTLKNTSPSAIGTQITPTILNNGTVGLATWGTGSGTASAMTVGPHQAPCNIGTPVSIGSTTYTPSTPSQSFAYNNSSNFTWVTVDPPASKTKYSWGACLTLGAATTATNLFDLIRTDGVNGSAATFQLQAGTCLNVEINVPSTQHSPCITVGSNPTLWCTGFVDTAAGLAKAACYQPVYPYTQVGSTVQISFSTTRGNLFTTRIGNGEVGTAAGTTNYFENLIFDYTTAAFPLGVGTQYAPWAGILSPTRAIDWRNAGVVGGIPARATACATLGTAGQLPTFVQSVTSAQINSAIAACPTGQTVFLNPGTYNGLGMLTFANHNNVTLRGAGADQTKLNFTSAAGCTGQLTLICMAGDNTDKSNPRNLTNWTAGYFPGATVITLAGPLTNISIGSPIILDEADDTTDTGGIVVSDTTSSMSSTAPGVTGPRSLEGNGGGASRSGRQQQQEVTVTGCNGSTTPGFVCSGSNVQVTISPGLYMSNWDASRSPQAWWSNTPGIGYGVENLSIDSGSDTNAAMPFKMLNTSNTYIKGVRSNAAYRAHVQLQFASHVTIQDSYFFLNQGGGPTNYGVECYGGSDVLVVNNIFQAVTGPILLNSACEGNVIAYNYATNVFYSNSAGWNNTASSEHTAGVEFNLYEGNVFNGVDGDVFHGTHHFVTFFRNRFAGDQPLCYSSGASYATAIYGPCNNNRIAIQGRSFSRFHNYVANVLGTSTTHTTYQSTGGDRVIFALNSGNTNGTVTVPNDPNVSVTSLRWGNYDTVTVANRWCGNSTDTGFSTTCTSASEIPLSPSAAVQTPYSNFIPRIGDTPAGQPALPSSFYYAATPSWWPVAKPWPPIGPDVAAGNITGVAGHANTIPAQDCFLGVMSGPTDGTGAVLSFNANTCYTSAGAPIAALSQASAAFFNQMVGTTTSLPTIVTLSNTGTAVLSISSLTLTGTNSADFGQSNACGAGIAAGTSCFITITFSPSVLGPRSATLNVNDNAAGSPHSVSLNGNGMKTISGTGKITGTGIVKVN